MLCIKKQIGTIFAIASPAIFCISGFWKSSQLMDPRFIMTGSWLACLIGFVAILMITGVQRRHAVPAAYVLVPAIALTLLSVLAATTIRDGVMISQGSALAFAGWRAASVVGMTGMVVSIFTATQIIWRYANANHQDRVAACTGLFKFVSLR